MDHDAFSRCHPAVNFLFFVGAIACSVLINHPAYLAASLFCAMSYYLCLKGRRALRMLSAMLPLFVLVAAINPLFNTAGAHPLFLLFGRPYTLEALCYGLIVAAMLVCTLLWFGCYNAVMTGDKFTALFGNLIPSLSLLLVMIFRLIPSLGGKLRRTSDARKCVGLGGSASDSLKMRLKNGGNHLSAVTDQALDGSIVTADSMRARGYGSGRRTSFRLYRLTKRDLFLMGLQVVLLAVHLLFAKTDVAFFPRLLVQNLSWSFAAYCAFLLLPTAMCIRESFVRYESTK